MNKLWLVGCAALLICINVVLWMPESGNISHGHRDMETLTIRATTVKASARSGAGSSADESSAEPPIVPGSQMASVPMVDASDDANRIPEMIVGGYVVKPLGTIPMDGRTGILPDYTPPGVHQVRIVDRAYGVKKIPWVLQKATTALAEWYHCRRTMQYLRGLRHPDGQLVSPCVGQMRNISQLAPPKLTPCDPGTKDDCVDRNIYVPKEECAYSYLGCMRDSVADERWNQWFRESFLPVFAVHSRTFLRPGEGVADADVVNKGFHIVSTCHHVLLTTAPWCGLRTSELNDWALDIHTGFPPGRVTERTILPEAKRKIFVTMAHAAKEPVSPDMLDAVSPENASLAAQIGQEVLQSAFKDPLVGRRTLLQFAKELFTKASNVGKLNAVDAAAIADLKWMAWPTVDGTVSKVDYTPIRPGWNENVSASDETIFAPVPTASPQLKPLLSAEDFPEETLERSPKHGSVSFQRVRQKYPVIFAVRRDDERLQLGVRPNRNTMLDYNGRINGFHVCIFGALRNFSSTVRQIRRRYLDTMRPQRIHIVTNDIGAKDYLVKGGDATAVQKVAQARAALFGAYMDLVPFAATMLAVPTGLPSRKNDCLHCRGAFMKELSRMSLLSDLKRNYAVELVFVFRPDSFPLIPLQLNPFFPEDHRLHVQGALMGYDPLDLPVESHEAPPEPNPPTSSGVQDADVIQYRLNATDYPYTIVRDRGFVPTHFGYINDINVTKYTVVFHTRVTLGLDFGWTGDPILFGHWNVVNHWLQHFSTTMGSATDLWEEKQPGEKHQYRFYARFLQPLFKLGVEAGALTHALDMRIFDFMFSLYRQNPSINMNLFALPLNFAAYQEMTIIRDYPTKYTEGSCKHYRFLATNVNLTQEYSKGALLTWGGSIGRVQFMNLPLEACMRSPTPPGLPTCYPPFMRVPLSSRNAFKAPCAPFCGHSNTLAIEGICLHTGKTGKHPRTFGKPNMATYSETPISRSHIEGEVQRFNVVFPQSVRRRNISDILP